MKLKIKLFSICAVFWCASSLQAQKVEITPQYGYQIGAKYNYYGGYLKIDPSSQYGATLAVNPNEYVSLEFMWAQQNSTLNMKDYIGYPQEAELSEIVVNHFQIGASHMFLDDEFRPFAGLSGGWSTFDPEDQRFGSTTTFTMGFVGGIKYFFTDNIGIRLQSQLLMPVSWGGVYVGSGGGGITTGGSVLQLNFTGGLIIGLGD